MMESWVGAAFLFFGGDSAAVKSMTSLNASSAVGFFAGCLAVAVGILQLALSAVRCTWTSFRSFLCLFDLTLVDLVTIAAVLEEDFSLTAGIEDLTAGGGMPQA